MEKQLVGDKRINYVSFTGSVANGSRVESAARGIPNGGFKRVGLELGGKDAAYVREDADPVFAAENVADGAFFNSGQSCCAVERVYVHAKVYDRFVDELVKVVQVRFASVWHSVGPLIDRLIVMCRRISWVTLERRKLR